MSRSPGLIEKAFWSVFNGVEQAIASENSNISNQSSFEEIQRVAEMYYSPDRYFVLRLGPNTT